MSKGTIIYIGGFELPDKNAAAHRVLNNGKILSELGYKVVFLGISHSAERVEEFDYQGFACHSIPYPKGFGAWLRHLGSVKDLQALIERYPDTKGVVFYNYPAIALWRGVRLCRKKGLFTVADATEWYLAAKKNPLFYCIKQADTSLRMRLVQPRMDGVIAISSYLSDYYRRKGCTVLQLPPLVDLDDRKWAVDRRPHNAGKVQLVYAGSPGDIKDNLALAVKSAIALQDRVKLHIVGIDSMPQEITQGSTNVIFHGRLSHQDCVRLVSRSDFQVFLRPDNLVTRAGFPTKLPESFACGTPVITNAHSNVADYLKSGENALLVNDLTEESVRRAMDQAAAMTAEEIAVMKERCRGFTGFDYRSHIPAMGVFLDQIMKKG